MIRQHGDMWTDADGQFKVMLATTCNVIRATASGKTLVMGTGSAKQLLDRYPYCEDLLVDYVESAPSGDYGCLWHPSWGFGVFQTKCHFRDPAVLEVIRLSTGGLLSAALMHPSFTFHLPFPGVGYGMLSPDVVLPIISVLPDNVRVWEYGDKL